MKLIYDKKEGTVNDQDISTMYEPMGKIIKFEDKELVVKIPGYTFASERVPVEYRVFTILQGKQEGHLIYFLAELISSLT